MPRVSKWDLAQYSGIYTATGSSKQLLVTHGARNLLLRVCATGDKFCVQPQDIRSQEWPEELFELGYCLGDGKSLSILEPISFIQQDGAITGVKVRIEKSKEASHYVKQPSQPSELLQLPWEVRRKILKYVFHTKNGTVQLRQSTGRAKIVSADLSSPRPLPEVNELQYVCRQLDEETRGMELLHNTLYSQEKAFLLRLSQEDLRFERNIQHLRMIGFEDVVKDRNAPTRLHPLLKFCIRNPQVQVTLMFRSWAFSSGPTILQFIRQGQIIEQAIRGMFLTITHSAMLRRQIGKRDRALFASDAPLVIALKGGMSTRELDARNLVIIPRRGSEYDRSEFHRRLKQLASRPSGMFKTILEEYGSLQNIINVVHLWHTKGI